MIGAVMPFARNAEIYGENDRVEYLYRVLKGSVRTCKVLRDGRRQIAGFYLPGDVFGFEAGDRHTLSAEAIVECQLLVLRRASVAALAARDSSVASQLWAMTIAELQRAQDQVMLAGQDRAGACRRISAGVFKAIARTATKLIYRCRVKT